MTVLYIVLGVIAVIALLLIIVSANNAKAMNAYLKTAYDALSAGTKMSEIPCGEYEELKVMGVMNFKTRQYEVENVGNLSVMKVGMGPMQMATFVLTPLYKDLPFMSCDFIFMAGNRKPYIEIYDLTDNKDEKYQSYIKKYNDIFDKYTMIEKIPAENTWYSDILNAMIHGKGKSKDDPAIMEMIREIIGLCVEEASEYPLLNEEEKKRKIDIINAYSNGLVEKGGTSTDVFKKSLGEEKTRDFFGKVFFGTKR